MTRVLTVLTEVLRDPRAVVERSADPAQLRELIPTLLGITLAGAALFGVVVGSYRGGLQIPFAALKMPLLIWIPVMLTLPVTHALWRAGEVEVSWQHTTMAGLVAMARTSVLAAATGPVLWLLYSLHPGYHLSVLILAGTLVVIGLPGLSVLASTMPTGGKRRGLAMLGSLLVLGLCTMQTGWLLRPFIARPTAEVTLLRPIEDDIFSSLGASTGAAVGVYDQDWSRGSQGILRQRGQR